MSSDLRFPGETGGMDFTLEQPSIKNSTIIKGRFYMERPFFILCSKFLFSKKNNARRGRRRSGEHYYKKLANGGYASFQIRREGDI